MHLRPLAIVSVLAGGDYLLWNWSLQGNHDVLALMAGLTLPPLALALVWLLALNGARLLARAARSSQQQAQQERGREPGRMRKPQLQPQSLTQNEQHQGGEPASTQASSSSSKLAA